MKIPSLFVLAATGLLLCGCVGAIYIPSFSKKPHSGQPLTARDVSFITVGKTTRAQVVKTLGGGFRDSPRVPAIAYAWEMPAGLGGAWAVGTHGGAAGSMEFTRWRALFLTFDARGVVARKEFVRLKTKLTLDEQLESWAGWVPPNTPPEILP